jgi:hypothetical protein
MEAQERERERERNERESFLFPAEAGGVGYK